MCIEDNVAALDLRGMLCEVVQQKRNVDRHEMLTYTTKVLYFWTNVTRSMFKRIFVKNQTAIHTTTRSYRSYHCVRVRSNFCVDFSAINLAYDIDAELHMNNTHIRKHGTNTDLLFLLFSHLFAISKARV